MKADKTSPKLVYLAFVVSTISLLAGFYVEQFDTSMRTAYNYMFFDSLMMAVIGLLWKDFGRDGIDIPENAAMLSIILLGMGTLLIGISPLIGVNFMYGQGVYLVGFLLAITPIFMAKK
jgi:hypothetical protein